MKFKIYLFLFLFNFFNINVFAENIPSKLFGIKIYDMVDKYSYTPGSEFFDYNYFEKKGLKSFAWMQVESGYFKMTENENFHNYAVYLSKEETLNKLAVEKLGENIHNVKIQGVEGYYKKLIYEDGDKLEKGCRDSVRFFAKIYSKKYNLRKNDFVTFNYANEIDSKFESHYVNTFSDEDLFLVFSCSYHIKESSLYSNMGISILNYDLYEEILASKNLKMQTITLKDVYNNITILKGI